MRKGMRRLSRSLWLSLGLTGVLVAGAFAADLHTDTSSTLSTNVSAPTEVGIGNNNFQIRVWATGSLQEHHANTASVVNRYEMAADGTVTPDATSTTVLTFTKPHHYDQACPSTGAIHGCQSNPFIVNATLVVASGTPNDTTGTLGVSMSGGSPGLAVGTLAAGHVKVVVAENYSTSFLRPVNPSGSAYGTVLNEIRNGRVVPLKLEIYKNGTEQDPSNVAATPTVKVLGIACQGSTAAAPDEEFGAAGSSNDGNTFRWSADDPGFWLYNLDTKALGLQAGKCYRVDAYIGGTLVTSNSTEWLVLKVAR